MLYATVSLELTENQDPEIVLEDCPTSQAGYTNRLNSPLLWSCTSCVHDFRGWH